MKTTFTLLAAAAVLALSADGLSAQSRFISQSAHPLAKATPNIAVPIPSSSGGPAFVPRPWRHTPVNPWGGLPKHNPSDAPWRK